VNKKLEVLSPEIIKGGRFPSDTEKKEKEIEGQV
jgi:hypothetical protein